MNTSEIIHSVQGAGEYNLSNREVLGFGGTAGYDATLNGKVLNLAITEAVNNLARAKTIILIAHRLTTVRTCDRIFLLEDGRLSASGTYDELVTRSKRFGDMVASLA